MARPKTILPPEETLSELETHLAGTLKPVAAPKGFRQRLRDRVRLPERRLIVERLSNWRAFFFAVGGAISGMLLIVTVGRALYHLFGRRNG